MVVRADMVELYLFDDMTPKGTLKKGSGLQGSAA